jgi:hypothetical protein
MGLTVRNVVEQLYRYLRKEQRTIPFDPAKEPHVDNPLPEALIAINGALQQMAVECPVFAARGLRSAFFRAPVTLAVSGLTEGAQTMPQPAGWAAWMAGCEVQLPGDEHANRILSTDGTDVTLQFPHLSSSTSGSATVTADSALLDADVIKVLPAVKTRNGVQLHAANGRFDLRKPLRGRRPDYGRSNAGTSGPGLSYYVESVMVPGAAAPRLSMMLHPAPAANLVVEFEVRASLGWFTKDDVFLPEVEDVTPPPPEIPVPVPAQFVESIFLPMALWRFLSSSVMRNKDIPQYVQNQAETAAEMLKKMRPQAEKSGSFEPGW